MHAGKYFEPAPLIARAPPDAPVAKHHIERAHPASSAVRYNCQTSQPQ